MRADMTKKDIAVLLGCVVFALASLGAIGEGGRRRAKSALCLSNLRQWGECFQMYLEDNDGYFPTGLVNLATPEGFWYWELLPYYGHNPDLRLCPEATKPVRGGNGKWGDPHSAWGKFDGSDGRWPKGLYGSYGINSWVYNQAPGKEPDRPVGQKGYWRTANVKGADKIPLLFGCTWVQPWPGPFPEDPPPKNEFNTGMGGMQQACLNRHNGAVNGLFVDFSARKIGLKELWTLKWHRVFDTEGPWTKAGGVTESDWPMWMRKYKDY